MQPKGTQFKVKYDTYDTGESYKTHRVTAKAPAGNIAGTMTWNHREVQSVDVVPDFRRQGVATAMWQEGHRMAGEVKSIPTPKHSSQRTNAGDAWAKSVGGRLPRRQ